MVAIGIEETDESAIPEVVLVAVRETILIGIDLRRIGRTLRRPVRPCVAVIRSKPLGGGEFRPCEIFNIGKRRLGIIVRVRIDAIGLDIGNTGKRRSVVETFAVAADFSCSLERNARAYPRFLKTGDKRTVAVARVGRHEVEIFVVANERGEVIADHLAADGIDNAHAVLVDIDVGDAVLVDVAHVIGREIFAGEDGLEHRVLIAAVIVLLGGKADERAGIGGSRLVFRRSSLAEELVGKRTAFFGLDNLQPSIEEAIDFKAILVLDRRIGVAACRALIT